LKLKNENKTKAIETTIIGIISTEMGYTNVSKICNSGREVFKYIGTLSYEEFKDIKNFFENLNIK
jgi:hypothetical protein